MIVTDNQITVVRAWCEELLAGEEGRWRAARAQLRRCNSAIDALHIPETLWLVRRLGGNERNCDRIAVLAVILAHLKPEGLRVHKTLARSLGRVSFDEKTESAVLSESRFRRLLQSEDDSELLDQFSRAVKMLKGEANPEDIARVILGWGDFTRKRMIFDYYAVFLGNVDSVRETAAEHV